MGLHPFFLGLDAALGPSEDPGRVERSRRTNGVFSSRQSLTPLPFIRIFNLSAHDTRFERFVRRISRCMVSPDLTKR